MSPDSKPLCFSAKAPPTPRKARAIQPRGTEAITNHVISVNKLTRPDIARHSQYMLAPAPEVLHENNHARKKPSKPIARGKNIRAKTTVLAFFMTMPNVELRGAERDGEAGMRSVPLERRVGGRRL